MIVYENAYISCICSQILCGGAEILGFPITKIWEVRLRGIHWLVQDPRGSCLNAEVRFSRAPRLHSKLSRAMLGVDRPQPWWQPGSSRTDSEPDSLDSWARVLSTLSETLSEITPPSQAVWKTVSTENQMDSHHLHGLINLQISRWP